MREVLLSGLGYLAAVTELLQRRRAAHPTAGLFEAADLQWWWRNERSTDGLGQLFWQDDQGRIEAAIIATDWGRGVALDPMLLPDASPAWRLHVMERGLAHVHDLGIETVSLEVDRDDTDLHGFLEGRGFESSGDATVETWLDAADRPAVSPLAAGFVSSRRSDNPDRPHHMISAKRNHTDPEPRLQSTSLYDASRDLVVYSDDNTVAAYGLFWYDPTTSTGLVEPMRTEDDHQGLGLARHVLTAGIDLLADAGAQRVKICYDPTNAAASHLYLSAGFQPSRETINVEGPTNSTVA